MRIPGIARLRVLDDRGRALSEWTSPVGDPAPLLTSLFFPRPFAATVQRNGSVIGRIEVWGDSSTLIDYVRLGLLAGLGCLLVTALGTIVLALLVLALPLRRVVRLRPGEALRYA